MNDTLGVGIIGCGNISTTYFDLAPLFRGLEIRACADMNGDAARARATQYGATAYDVGGLLNASEVDIVLNLTIPDAHAPITMQALAAGKHVYSEKPLALSIEEGIAMRDLAASKGLRVGCAPDTFLGGAPQLARALVDAGRVGRIASGTAHLMGHGMEDWHPNPDFFYAPGAGPVMDMGPYYIANLINILGPVAQVAALSSSAYQERTIKRPPRAGETVPVLTPTTIHALLEFANGATITLSNSWDVWSHRHGHTELYGTEGTLYLPDPNFFGGALECSTRDSAPETLGCEDHPFGRPNQEEERANYRTAGLADMALALLEGRDHRCSLERTLHGVDVMTSILKSGETKSFVELQTTCTRPQPLGIEAARALLKPQKGSSAA